MPWTRLKAEGWMTRSCVRYAIRNVHSVLVLCVRRLSSTAPITTRTSRLNHKKVIAHMFLYVLVHVRMAECYFILFYFEAGPQITRARRET